MSSYCLCFSSVQVSDLNKVDNITGKKKSATVSVSPIKDTTVRTFGSHSHNVVKIALIPARSAVECHCFSHKRILLLCKISSLQGSIDTLSLRICVSMEIGNTGWKTWDSLERLFVKLVWSPKYESCLKLKQTSPLKNIGYFYYQ